MAAETSPSGLLIIDKPAGPTSHDVVGRVRRVSGVRRVGHAGTLDPLATGVLLVCLGQTTRLVEYLTGQDKTYETTVRLGQTTTTYDAEGEIIRERSVDPDAAALSNALTEFRGPIRQQVPAFSAVKQDGQPLYKTARRGEAVDAPSRNVVIHTLDLLAFEPPFLSLRVVCSSGTYIRSLAHDLGERLGCGGHIAALRRTAVGDFTLAEAIAMDDLSADNWQGCLRPPERAVAHLPQVEFSETEATRLGLGQRLASPEDQPDGLVAALGPGGRFLGVVEADGGVWRPRKMLAAAAG